MRAVTASIENVITTQNSTGNDDEEYLTFLVLFLMDIKYDGALKMKCFNDFLLTEVVLFPTFARKASSQAKGDDKGRFLTEKRKKSLSYCNLYWKIMFLSSQSFCKVIKTLLQIVSGRILEMWSIERTVLPQCTRVFVVNPQWLWI